ncbi:hypothetical protein MflW12_2620 [Mesoplasma florum]|uniref:Uncharacterized protein n=1 Tax=Mesoplasma florum TaxID=2151 RepID=A0AAD0MQQ5_MESFO|nr:hypothetical protein MflW12_2620 [Mesoplasma florum]
MIDPIIKHAAHISSIIPCFLNAWLIIQSFVCGSIWSVTELKKWKNPGMNKAIPIIAIKTPIQVQYLFFL